MLGALERLRRAVTDCANTPVWSLPDADLLTCLDTVHQAEQALAAIKLHVIRQIDAPDVPSADLARTSAAWLRARLRIRPDSSKRLVELAKAVDKRPDLDQALITGAVNLEQAAVIDDCLTSLPADVGGEAVAKAETLLIGWAAEFDPPGLTALAQRILAHIAPEIADAADAAALARQEKLAFAARTLTLHTGGDGKVHLRGILDTEAAATVAAALDPLCAPRHSATTWRDLVDSLDPDPATLDERTPGQRRADALVDVCRLVLNTNDLPDNGGNRPQLTITVSLEQLRTQMGAVTLDTGQRLTATQVRRLACDAQILPAVLGTEGQVLDVGRTRRLITGPLRNALVLRDRGCTFPGCSRPPRWTDGHHIRSWIDGGRTSLDNSVLLCRPHHRLVHTGDWQVRLGTDGFPDFIPPTHLDLQQRPRRNIYHRRT
jgi:hypothetical protein